MLASKIHPAYEEFLDYLVRVASPEEIMAFKFSPAAQTRIEILTERNKSDQLSEAEREELDQLIEVDGVVSLLKAKAAKNLKAHERDQQG